MSYNKIDSFSITLDERYAFAGTYGGELLTINLDSFEIEKRIQIHTGSIETMAHHPTLPYIGLLAMDGSISILKYNDQYEIKVIHTIVTRNIRPDDGYEKVPTVTQALCFHKTKLKVAGHGGSAGLFEMDFTDDDYEILHCTRLHGNYDFSNVMYVEDTDMLLSGNVVGEVVLSDGPNKLRYWNLGVNSKTHGIHWFERIAYKKYLIASDGMRAISLDLETSVVVEGPIFAKDHMEHITQNKINKRIYAVGFDRKVYELEQEGLSVKNIVWTAPFKMRWIKTLERQPDWLFVNCRNGGFYKINNETGDVIGCLKESPDALWTADIVDDEIFIAGEGRYYLSLKPDTVDSTLNRPTYTQQRYDIPVSNYFYTKRLAVSNDKSKIIFGRSNGDLVIKNGAEHSLLCKLDDAVRDLVFAKDGQSIFIVCEDNKLYQVSTETGTSKVLYESDTPLWALALNPNGRILAFGNRLNNTYLYDLNDGSTELINNEARFIKRMKWLDENTLLIGSSSTLFKYDLKAKVKTVYTSGDDNTIEDFHWDAKKRYLIVLSYSRTVHLYDLVTSESMFVASVGHDYGKGVLFLDENVNPTKYDADFIAFGRDGYAKYFRIHNEMILSLGLASSLEKSEKPIFPSTQQI